jgi:hypothetical protein
MDSEENITYRKKCFSTDYKTLLKFIVPSAGKYGYKMLSKFREQAERIRRDEVVASDAPVYHRPAVSSDPGEIGAGLSGPPPYSFPAVPSGAAGTFFAVSPRRVNFPLPFS